jgi:hypothetical protein
MVFCGRQVQSSYMTHVKLRIPGNLFRNNKWWQSSHYTIVEENVCDANELLSRFLYKKIGPIVFTLFEYAILIWGQRYSAMFRKWSPLQCHETILFIFISG